MEGPFDERASERVHEVIFRWLSVRFCSTLVTVRKCRTSSFTHREIRKIKRCLRQAWCSKIWSLAWSLPSIILFRSQFVPTDWVQVFDALASSHIACSNFNIYVSLLCCIICSLLLVWPLSTFGKSHPVENCSEKLSISHSITVTVHTLITWQIVR